MEPQNVIESNTVLIGKLKIINNYKKKSKRNEKRKPKAKERKGESGNMAKITHHMKIMSGTK